MAISEDSRPGRCRFATAAALLIPALSSAAPGFVASSRVSGDAAAATIEVDFNCKVAYLQHQPETVGDVIRVFLEPTEICNGVSPTTALSRGRYRPVNSDLVKLVDLQYDGESATQALLTLRFSEPVRFDLDPEPLAFRLVVHVRPASVESPVGADNVDQQVSHRQVRRPQPQSPEFVVNLASMRRVPTRSDLPPIDLGPGQRIFYSEAIVGDTRWYRLRLGDFGTAEEARRAMALLAEQFPDAWIDHVDPAVESIVLTLPAIANTGPADGSDSGQSVPAMSDAGELMAEARAAMLAGELSRAIQIYTKVLQMPGNALQPEAQEYLALAREKNGQVAHAKAEYQRYLALYPNSEGAARVSQRLAALLAVDRSAGPREVTATAATRPRPSDWRMQTFFSQYYRRDVNNLQTEQGDIVSQSALYSDVNLDLRRRGERFDFATRITAGHRNDFLGEKAGSGNETTVSYAYADLADAGTGLRGRIGRQTRTSGGVLGRFDGINLGYQAADRLLLNAVYGYPAYSASNSFEASRVFHGVSLASGPWLDGLEVGAYYIAQQVEGIEDRSAVGGEFRYFGDSRSLWGFIDFDTSYGELSSAFLQASLRIGSRLTINGAFDQRHSPFLSTGNALIGQPVSTFSELLEIYPVDEIRQFGLDRSPLSTTYTLGVTLTVTPRLEVAVDCNDTTVGASPESGGVPATPEFAYRYYSTNLIASSLLTEGDVTIVGFRQSESDTSTTTSLTLDTRFPFGRSWRVNPRMRIDRRERVGDPNDEWILSPGVRIQYRPTRRLRIDLEAGRQYAQRETELADLDRESWYVNVGYQLFF